MVSVDPEEGEGAAAAALLGFIRVYNVASELWLKQETRSSFPITDLSVVFEVFVGSFDLLDNWRI